MQDRNLPKLVTVFGGSGFVGRHVVRALARRGYRIRVATRRPDLAFHLQPLGNVGQIAPVQANLRYRDSVDAAVAGADHVVNCVGILHETGRNTFDAVQDFGARAVAEAARAAGAGLTQISAIGANPDAASDYARTKGRAEQSVLDIVPSAIILRPSVIFGPEDDFFNRFAEMARLSPVLPLIGGGHTRFQPVYVGDVAEMVARSVEGRLKPGTIYELGGPEAMTFRQCLKEMLSVIRRDRLLVPLPWGLASLIGTVAGFVPFITPPITADQVENLKVDNVVSEEAMAEGRTLEAEGIRPTAIDAVLPSYLVRYRPQGQYTDSGKGA
ncbi:complex I NDUFA9 subunit family protein [Pseudohoeflea coraliihabitans]|uniref:Complex I NDUFA9 subunit family protein n=1 Tax=Pseudohoeflea coraliihabitans TaxID=2860393 RepID=A0ABS6WVF1_9HYPH|nr:complex I NDUFA9 subunit family protein [Pseudohoeflea sp. DP4N28-3]MBW3099074.1 complex I NDUFA9 subunit family protein [Pseudohoeflea sp. DP4N28-3]